MAVKKKGKRQPSFSPTPQTRARDDEGGGSKLALWFRLVYLYVCVLCERPAKLSFSRPPSRRHQLEEGGREGEEGE